VNHYSITLTSKAGQVLLHCLDAVQVDLRVAKALGREVAGCLDLLHGPCVLGIEQQSNRAQLNYSRLH